MSELVRVRLANGGHASIPAARAQSLGLKPLKAPARLRDGRPAPFKPRAYKSAVAATSAPSTAADAAEVQED